MTFTKHLMAAAIVSVFAYSGYANALSKAEIKTEGDAIAAQYKSAKAKCDGLKANAKDICMAEAKGAHDVSKAEFEVRQNDTPKTRNNVRVIKADADYGVAKEKCDDLAGNAKDVCVKDAKAMLVTAKADAKADLESGNAKRGANEKVSEARKDAAEDKRDANYAAAKVRCDKFTSDTKDRCIADAKVQFGVK